MSPVLVATSAYGASIVRQLGQTHFIDVVADAGAAGIDHLGAHILEALRDRAFPYPESAC